MSIVDKLTYLQTTKQLLKTEINKINNVLDDNSTFRIYPQELFNGYLDVLNNGTDTLWNNLEKVSQTGTEAVLEGVETAPIKMVLNGNTSQETSILPDGYQQVEYIESDGNQYIDTGYIPNDNTKITSKFQLPTTSQQTYAALFGTQNASTGRPAVSFFVNTNFSARFSDDTNYALIDSNLKINTAIHNMSLKFNELILDNTKYIGSNTFSVPITNSIYIFARDYNSSPLNASYSKVKLYNLKIYDDGTLVRDFIPCYRKSDNVIGLYDLINGVFYTNLGTENFTKGADAVLPNPDYPQEVKVVTGENVVSVSGKNLQEMLFTDGSLNGVEWHIENDGSIIINGTTTGNVAIRYNRSNLMPVVEGKTYTLSATGMENIVNFGYKNSSTGNNIAVVTPSSPSLTFEATSDMISKANRLDLYIRADKTFVNQKVTLQLEEGSTASEYTPFSKTDYPINLNPNLVDFSTFENGYVDGTNGGIVGRTASHEMVSPFVKVKPSTTYTIKIKDDGNGSPNWFGIGEYTTNAQSGFIFRNAMNRANLPNYSSFITSPTTEYIRASARNLTAGVSEVQLVEGVSLMELPIELCKINTYKDYFHKDSGKWYVHKAIGKKILDGSENYTTNSSWNYTNTNNYITALDSKGTISELRTNYFKYVSNTFALDTNGIASRVLGTHIIFRINKTIAPTIEDFKTWLSTHNTIVYYVLATPTETEITNSTLIEQLEAISKAKSVKDKTYITQTNDELPFILDVEAIKEYSVE